MDVGKSSDTSTHRWKPGFTATNAIQSGGNYTHTYVGGSVSDSVTKGGTHYYPGTGTLAIQTTTAHGMSNGDWIKVTQEALKFKCAMDNEDGTHAYPRGSDPKYDKWLQVTNTTATTFEVNVGTTAPVKFTPSAATYDPTTGLLTLTIGNHSLEQGLRVKLANRGLTFTCGMDGHSSEHVYPRFTDPKYDRPIPITSVTATTVTLNIGISPNTSDHTFVSAVPDALVTGGSYPHQFHSCVTNGILQKKDSSFGNAIPITGVSPTSITVNVLKTVPSTNISNHTFVSADSGAISSGGNYLHSFVSATDNGIIRSIVNNESIGSGATFNVVVDETGAATVTLASSGSGYTDNDVLTLSRVGTFEGDTDITIDVDGTSHSYNANDKVYFDNYI